MKIQKSELAEKLNMVKGIVPKKTTMPVLQNVLIADGYMIANDTELFAKVALEYEGEGEILIPMEAFDMISSLPDGEVEITPSDKDITIKVGKIKNKYALMQAVSYPKPSEASEGLQDFKIESGKFIHSAKKVLYAVAMVGNNQTMASMCLKAKNGKLNFIGLEGHIVSWDKIDYEGDFELLIPRAAIARLTSIGLTGEMTISYNNGNAVFKTDACEVGTRLVEGNFFDVEKIMPVLPLEAVMEKKAFLESLSRARMCVEENTPVKLSINGGTCGISAKSPRKEYDETLDLVTDIQQPIEISFNPRLLMESVKSVEEDNVKICLKDAKTPAILKGDDQDYVAMVLPVKTR